MRRLIHILSIHLTLALCFCAHSVISQEQAILDFTVKELNGDTLKFKDRLDPNTNYIIETMAFWCNPCIRSINRFNYHKQYWNERFNVDILLLEDEHWDELEYVENEMDEYGWDLDIVVSNDEYSNAGINSIPRYYFKGAASDTLERVYGNIEKFLLERVDSILFEPILDMEFKQALIKDDCDQIEIYKFEGNDTIIQGQTYQFLDQTLIRENEQNGNIIRFDQESGKEEIHIKYSAALCSRLWLKDFDGDSLLIKILDRYQVDSVLHIVTDQVMNDGCEDELPFEFIQQVGTNAGLNFDIEDGKIISRLICHESEGELLYVDSEFGDQCQTLSTKPFALSDLDIQPYPNPATSMFAIPLSFEGEKKIEVFDIRGNMIHSQTTNANSVEVIFPVEFTSSLYLVRVSSKFGVVTRKVVRVED